MREREKEIERVRKNERNRNTETERGVRCCMCLACVQGKAGMCPVKGLL